MGGDPGRVLGTGRTNMIMYTAMRGVLRSMEPVEVDRVMVLERDDDGVEVSLSLHRDCLFGRPDGMVGRRLSVLLDADGLVVQVRRG